VTELDRATVDHLLRTTRSVRKRLDLHRPVPRAVITECLELAVQAPTGSNQQLWRWIVVEDAATRATMAELYRTPPADGTPADRAPADHPPPVTTPQQQRVMDSARYLLEHLHEVPVLVVPCTAKKGGAAGWAPSIYPAVWSFMLALRSRGLGSCITTGHLYREREAAEVLGIPEGYAQACLLPVAFYVGDDFRPAARRPSAEITYWNRWGQTAP
jgi:nitroreductase